MNGEETAVELRNPNCEETRKLNNDDLSSMKTPSEEDQSEEHLVLPENDVAEKASSSEKESSDTKGLSKNKLKKLRKIQRWEEVKSLKRKKEKEKKRAKRQAIRDAGVEVQKKRKTFMTSDVASKIRVALDLSFNSLMTEKDQRKVVKQVLRSYSMNRQSSHPLQLHLTNFDEGNKELFGKFSTGYKSWDIHVVEENHINKFDKNDLVYLTSDSSNILKELDEKKVYVIGGIVDHNSHKGLCFDLAEKAGIGHARLPIDEYIKLEGRKILPINHVFEILLHFVEFSDWEKAFYHVIPKRKGVTLHQSKTRDSTCSLTMPAIDEASETEDRTMLFNQEEEEKNREVVA